MSDRYHSLTVVLEHDIRDDDAEPLIEAIKMFRGVVSVKGNVTALESHVASQRARHELSGKIWKALEEK